MAVEIRTRETWSRGAEVSFEVEAWLGETKLFAPGATVTRDRPFAGSKLVVSIGWPSSNSDRRIEDAEAQLAVMEAAVLLGHKLQANAETLRMEA